MTEFNEDQKRAIKYAVEGHNLFLTGPAGVGKSYTVNEIVRLLKEMNKNVSITAATGIAADHINGCTLHSWVGCGLAKEKAEILANRVRRNSKALERWTSTDVLIIDETSMLDFEFVTKIDLIAKIVRGSSLPFGGLQMIFVGDYYQVSCL
jgi:ATP-dependent DNA helicase PIF1